MLTTLEQQGNNSNNIISITPRKVMKILKADESNGFGYRGLFPVTYSCIPYGQNDTALKHILDTCLIVYSPPVQESNASGTKHGLSVSSMIEIPSGIHFNTFYYGQSDISVLSQHLLFIIS